MLLFHEKAVVSFGCELNNEVHMFMFLDYNCVHFLEVLRHGDNGVCSACASAGTDISTQLFTHLLCIMSFLT